MHPAFHLVLQGGGSVQSLPGGILAHFPDGSGELGEEVGMSIDMG